jgi:hypothetical protein
MIDPITIGIAFTAAQQSVNYIKKAIALGKDVNSLYGQFSKFFENSDKVHEANTKAQGATAMLTDGQIRSLALQLAMHSKALRDAEKELKEILVWSGNKDVWDQMIAERVRLYKERAKLKREQENARIQAQADLLDKICIFIAFVALGIPAVGISFALLIR